MCETKPDNVSIDENIPLDYVKRVCQDHDISFGGNLQLTVVLLMGKEDDARRNAIECMDIGGDTGFILAPGCDLPYAVPPTNLIAGRLRSNVRPPERRRLPLSDPALPVFPAPINWPKKAFCLRFMSPCPNREECSESESPPIDCPARSSIRKLKSSPIWGLKLKRAPRWARI